MPQPTDSNTTPPPINRLLVFAIIAMTLMMMAADGTIVATALDALKDGLDTSINWASWTITAYALGFVLMLPISGKMTERYGNRRVFFGSVVTFTAASLCCGVANNIYTLIFLRVIQAAGGAGFTPAATGIIVQHFGDARDRAVGLFGSFFPMGAMIGPIFGGLFVTYWSWRGIFLFNVPFGAVAAFLTWRYVPHDTAVTKHRRTPLDAKGLLLLGVFLMGAMFAATSLGDPHVYASSAQFIVPLVIAIIALPLFLRHIQRTANPFILPKLIHGTGFGTVNVINIIYGGSTIGLLILVPVYAISRYGMTALDAGTLLVAQGVAAIIFSSAAAFFLRSTGYRVPLYCGASVNAAGMLLLAITPQAGISPYIWLACATLLIGIGTGIVNPASRNAGLQLEPDKAPSIAAVRSMCMQGGQIITISIATAIIADATDPGHVQAWIYVAAAIVLFASLPMISRVPEHRGAW